MVVLWMCCVSDVTLHYLQGVTVRRSSASRNSETQPRCPALTPGTMLIYLHTHTHARMQTHILYTHVLIHHTHWSFSLQFQQNWPAPLPELSRAQGTASSGHREHGGIWGCRLSHSLAQDPPRQCYSWTVLLLDRVFCYDCVCVCVWGGGDTVANIHSCLIIINCSFAFGVYIQNVIYFDTIYDWLPVDWLNMAFVLLPCQ